MKTNIHWGRRPQPAVETILELMHHRMRAGPETRVHWQYRIGEILTAATADRWDRVGMLAERTTREVRRGEGHRGLAFKLMTLLMLDGWAPDRFPPRARKALGDAVLAACEARGRAFTEYFERQNDNMPMMWMAIQILGGELLGRRDVIELGMQKLRRYSCLMSTVGVTSEYCSPNYFPWHLAPLSLVAARSRSREARRRAAAWCDFIWFEIAQRWHAGLVQLIGPHSRLYTGQIYGAWSYAHAVMHRLTGAPYGLDPLELGYRTGHHGDHPVAAYFALAPIGCPPWVRRVLTGKAFPSRVAATTQVGTGTAGSAALFGGTLHTMSYATARWSLAGSSRPWNGGWQSNVAVAYWNLAEPVRSPCDQRAAYARLLFDDHGPLRANVYPNTFAEASPAAGPPGSPLAFHDDGLCHAIQHDNALLLATRPLWRCRPDRHTAIRQTLLISAFAARKPEIWVAGRPLARLPYRAAGPEIVVLRDGPVVVGLRPTAVSDLGRRCALEIERREDHYWISLWNYRGPSRAFSADELQSVRNGFFWVIEDAGQISPEALHARLAAAEMRDDVVDRHRRVRYRDEKVALALTIHRDCPDPHRLESGPADYAAPMFSSPYVQGGFDRDLVVGEAVLEANPHPLFLRGDPAGREYAVYNLAGRPCDWTLRLGGRSIRRRDFGFGVETLRAEAKPRG